MNLIDYLRSKIKPGRMVVENPNAGRIQEMIRASMDAKAQENARLARQMGEYDISMYNPRRDQTDADPWIAPRNFNLKEGTARGGKYVAAARKAENDPTPMLPYGTKVNIRGTNYEVRDLMGATADGKPQWGIKRLDIFHPDESEAGKRHALKFGRQRIPVESVDDLQ